MSFDRIGLAAWGNGMWGGVAHAEPRTLRIFTGFPESDQGPQTGIRVSSGTFLSLLSDDHYDTPLIDIEWVEDDLGSKDFKFSLNRAPEVPLERMTEIDIYMDGTKVFRGYIWKYPEQGREETKAWKYSGFGMRKRLEKLKITLRKDIELYGIDSIAKSGSDIVITTDENLFTTAVVGRVALVKGAEEEINDGRYTITAASSNSITVLNPAGLTQSITLGQLFILPEEWSDPTTLNSDIIKHAISNYLGDTPLSSSTAAIQESTGISTGSIVDLGGIEVKEFFEHIRLVTPGWRFYTNPDSVQVFEPIPTALQGVLIEGHDFDELEIETDDDIVNYLNLLRKRGREEDRQGYEDVGIVKDDTSIALNGKFEEDMEFPVNYGETLVQTIGQKVVDERKDPRTTYKLKNCKWQYYPMGKWKVITKEKFFRTTLNHCETLDDWTVSGSLSKSIDLTDRVRGAGSFKVEFDSGSNNETIDLAVDRKVVLLRKIYFYFRCSRVGMKIRFGFGESSWTEKQWDIEADRTGWKLLEFETDSVSFSKIGAWRYEIINSEDDDFFHVEEIEIVEKTALHLELQLREAKYEMKAEKVVSLTMGQRERRTDNFMASMLRRLNNQAVALRD